LHCHARNAHTIFFFVGKENALPILAQKPTNFSYLCTPENEGSF